jgi:tape measure domain-containing protein
MASIATLNVKLTASIGAFSAAMHRAATPLRAFGAQVTNVGSMVAGLVTKIGGLAAVGAAVAGGALLAGAVGLGVWAVKLAADAEQSRVSFTVMLGSAEKARELMGEINQFAASTPFQTTELIGASKSLLAFGVAQDQIIPTMRTLGDLAAGLNIPIGELSELYGKARVQGRLFAQDVNQLTGRGIPVIQEFAKQFGVTEGEVKGLVESGKIGFPQLQKALVSLTSDGGKFAGLMDAQSKTLAGVWSTLQDTITLNVTKIGEAITSKINITGLIQSISTVGQIIADMLIPVVGTLMDDLIGLAPAGMSTTDVIIRGLELVSKAFAHVLHAVDALRIAGNAIGIAMLWSFEQAIEGAEMFAKGVAWVVNEAIDIVNALIRALNKIPKVSIGEIDFKLATDTSMTDAVQGMSKMVRAEMAKEIDSLSTFDRAERVGKFFDEVRRRAGEAAKAANDVKPPAPLKIETGGRGGLEDITERLTKLRQQVAEFGQTDLQKLVAELQKLGATEAEISEATGLQKQLDALEKAKKRSEELAQQGKSVFDATRTPLEKYETKIGELNDMLEAGSINWDTYGRAVRAARGELESGTGQPVAPELFKAGTAAAQRFMFEQTKGTQRLSRDDLPKQQLAEAKDANRALERIEQNTRSGPGNTITLIDKI